MFVWNATTYEQVFMGELGSIDPTCDVDFSPDSTRLVTGNYYSTATIWDIATHQKVRTLDVNKNSPVEAVKYSPQGDRIATASCESIRVWDSNDGRLLVDIKVPGLGILWFNKYLFVAAKDRTLKQINAATGSTVSEWRVSDTIFVPHIALPQHGKFIAYSTSNTLTFWDTSAHTQLGPIQHIDDIRSMACSPDGQLLAIAAGEKIIVKDMSSTISRFILVCFLRSVFTTSVSPHFSGPRTGYRRCCAHCMGTWSTHQCRSATDCCNSYVRGYNPPCTR